MKTVTTLLTFISLTCIAFAGKASIYRGIGQTDTIKLKIDSDRNVYYQKTVPVKGLTIDVIYTRAVQFMAAKNIQLTYGYQQEGKLIFTTTQDLNFNSSYVGDENDTVMPYTAQFAIIIDLKNGSYRFTINNIVLFYPTQTGNKRETLLDIYVKATNTDSKRVARNAKIMLFGFERFLTSFVDELHAGIEQKAVMYSPRFY